MKNLIYKIIFIFILLVAPSFSNEICLGNVSVKANAPEPSNKKDSCVQIFTTNNNGYNILKVKKNCFDIDVSIEVRCRYIVINKKTGEKIIGEAMTQLAPNEIEWTFEWVADTLYEYGDIIDCKVTANPFYFCNYYQAYGVGGNRLPYYDIEIRHDLNSDEYYASYYVSRRRNLVERSPIAFSNPYEISFLLKNVDIEENSYHDLSRDVKIIARINKDGLKGTLNTDYEREVFFDRKGRFASWIQNYNCGNIIIVYKNTEAFGVIQE